MKTVTDLAETIVGRYEPDKLAELAAREATLARRAFEKGIRHIVKAGEYLCALKVQCAHGQWLPYLRGTGISQPAASNYMRIARAWHSLPEEQPDGSPWTITAAIAYIQMLEEAPPRTSMLRMTPAARLRQRGRRLFLEFREHLTEDRDLHTLLEEWAEEIESLRRYAGEINDTAA